MALPFILSALALAAMFPSAVAAADTPQAGTMSEPPPEPEILALEPDPHERLTVPVKIGTGGPYRFLVDTGAQATVLSRTLADQLQLLDRESALLVGMASRQRVTTAMIPQLTIGLRTFPIRSAPLLEQENIGADGILGLDSLQGQRVMLDFVENTISVADAEALGGVSGFEIVVRARRKLGQLIVADARLNGIPVAVVIDTGAQGSVGNLPLLRRLHRADELGQSHLTDVNGVQVPGGMRLARNFDLGRVRLSQVALFFADAPPFAALGLSKRPALILGMRDLRAFRRVAIDFAAQRILFDLPTDASWQSALNDRF
ncbi:aspartyl protease family protein [Altericroceibacterium xinjiangense]|uniref:aspartyl protease family protein n=1 Tax=Altericroceibacterium xinjiangense TaxID=762261 RepID=UPI000F7E4E85|nr:aspartyl protease family protein [Altericroceibacterium xinjiangense]